MARPVDDSLVVIGGNATPRLAQEICTDLGTQLGAAEVSRFPDGEVCVRLLEDVRGRDVFVVQSTCPPVNENLMELLIIVDCVKRCSAARVTAVIPYFGYARQDRRDHGQRVPISAKLVANLIVAAGADRVLTMDLHCEQIQGFFDIPVDHVYGGTIFAEYFHARKIPDLVVVSPDVGSIRMARWYSKELQARLATVDKRRINPEETEIEFIIGEVDGRNALISDDMIATGGSIAQAARLVHEKGAREIYIACTHPVLCGPAIEKLERSPIQGIYVTDTVPVEGKYEGDRVTVLSSAHVFGDAIRQIHASAAIGRGSRK
ncbi:MAG: ribose-phosphate diphosphokinase [Planctomycetota bacterium]